MLARQKVAMRFSIVRQIVFWTAWICGCASFVYGFAYLEPLKAAAPRLPNPATESVIPVAWKSITIFLTQDQLARDNINNAIFLMSCAVVAASLLLDKFLPLNSTERGTSHQQLSAPLAASVAEFQNEFALRYRVCAMALVLCFGLSVLSSLAGLPIWVPLLILLLCGIPIGWLRALKCPRCGNSFAGTNLTGPSKRSGRRCGSCQWDPRQRNSSEQ